MTATMPRAAPGEGRSRLIIFLNGRLAAKRAQAAARRSAASWLTLGGAAISEAAGALGASAGA
jgi:hypothetical protein